jgi:type I restriction enzyme S subunit
MFSSRAPIGYVAINEVDAATNQGFKSVVPGPALFNEYLYYYLKASKQLAEERATGTTFKEISGSAFAVLPLPVPPIREQHRIVAKIEELFSELDKAVENVTLARAQLKTYRRALLKAAFEGRLTADWRRAYHDKLESPEALLLRINAEREARDKQALDSWQAAVDEWRAGGQISSPPRKPAGSRRQKSSDIVRAPELPLPYGWTYTRLGSVLDVVSGGTPRGVEDVKGHDFPFYKVADMNNALGGRWMDSAKLSLSADELDALGLTAHPVGTVIFPKRGGAILTNKKRQIRFESCFDLNVMGVISGLNAISEDFIWYWFQALDLSYIYDGSSVPQINNKNVEPLAFPICSRAEQDELTTKLSLNLSQIDAMDAEISNTIARIGALRQSVLKNAFSGQLVPQDPTDEPAAALLARLNDQGTAPRTRRRKTA